MHDYDPFCCCTECCAQEADLLARISRESDAPPHVLWGSGSLAGLHALLFAALDRDRRQAEPAPAAVVVVGGTQLRDQRVRREQRRAYAPGPELQLVVVTHPKGKLQLVVVTNDPLSGCR